MNLNETLTIAHYKEPLKKVLKTVGFGYFGALSMTLDGDKLQCHICGELHYNVALHARQAHSILSSEYKERFEIARETSLISETLKEKFKINTMKWLASLSFEQKKVLKKKQLEAIKAYWKNAKRNKFEIRLETKNKRGTCPDQLLEKIREVKTSLGHTPSKDEFIIACDSQRYVHLIYKTFGSWKKAIQRAKLPLHKKVDQKKLKFHHYNKDALLEDLFLFWKENNKVPTEADSRRGLIVNADVYRRHFGGLPKARFLAGIEE